MKVLLINGSPHKNGCTFVALSEAAKTLNKNGIETDFMHIPSDTSGCRACKVCKKTGKCIIDDMVNEFLAKLPEIDGIIVGSPVYFAGAAGQLTAFLDRAFMAGGGKFDGKLAASVVSCRRGGATAAFDQLNKYFLMNCMPCVGSQYWNQVHGSKAEDVSKDEEGLQTMRTLATQMAWLLKCVEAGKKEGFTVPEREERITTSFIR